jgi:hypothetical protein
VWRRALVVWVLLVGLAILNGIIRATVLLPRLGAAAGHLVSSVVLAGLIALTAWVTTPWIGPGTRRAWAVGILRLSLTVAFEFLAGHYAFGHPGRACSPTTTSCEACVGAGPRRDVRRAGLGVAGSGPVTGLPFSRDQFLDVFAAYNMALWPAA